MKIFIVIVLFLACKMNINATSVLASSFGWNTEDATSDFQEAVNSSSDAILCDSPHLQNLKMQSDTYGWLDRVMQSLPVAG